MRTEFWIQNITKLNVSLGDLRITVPAKGKFNLLDKAHFKFTLEQLEESAASGSLYKKSDKIKIRENKPPPPFKPTVELSTECRYIPKRSVVEIVEKEYDELILSDEKFASEAIDDE